MSMIIEARPVERPRSEMYLLALWTLKGTGQLKWVVRQVKWKGLSLLWGKAALASDSLNVNNGPRN